MSNELSFFDFPHIAFRFRRSELELRRRGSPLAARNANHRVHEKTDLLVLEPERRK